MRASKNLETLAIFEGLSSIATQISFNGPLPRSFTCGIWLYWSCEGYRSWWGRLIRVVWFGWVYYFLVLVQLLLVQLLSFGNFVVALFRSSLSEKGGAVFCMLESFFTAISENGACSIPFFWKKKKNVNLNIVKKL